MLVASFVKHWQQNFIVSVVVLLVTIVSFIILYSYMEKKMVVKENEETKAKKETQKAPIKPLMFSSGLIVFLVVCLLRVSIDNGIKMMTPVMIMESYANIPAAIATRMSTVLVIFSAIGILIAGFMKSNITGNEPKAQIILMGISVPPLLLVCFVGKVHYGFVYSPFFIAHKRSIFSEVSFLTQRY